MFIKLVELIYLKIVFMILRQCNWLISSKNEENLPLYYKYSHHHYDTIIKIKTITIIKVTSVLQIFPPPLRYYNKNKNNNKMSSQKSSTYI